MRKDFFKRELKKNDLRLILLSLDNLIEDETFSKCNTSISLSVLDTLKYLKYVLSDLSYELHNDDKSIKEVKEDFSFYHPDFEVEYLDLLPYGLYDELDEVPLTLFYSVRNLAYNIRSLYYQL